MESGVHNKVFAMILIDDGSNSDDSKIFELKAKYKCILKILEINAKFKMQPILFIDNIEKQTFKGFQTD